MQQENWNSENWNGIWTNKTWEDFDEPREGTCAQKKRSLIVKSLEARESRSHVGKEGAVLVWSIGSVICGGDAVGGRPDGLDQLPETFICVRGAYELLFSSILVLFIHSIFLCKSF